MSGVHKCAVSGNVSNRFMLPFVANLILTLIIIAATFTECSTWAANCPHYCQCGSLSQLRVNNGTPSVIVACRIDDHLDYLECGVTWRKVHLTAMSFNLKPNVFSLCNFILHLTFTSKSRLTSLSSQLLIGLDKLASLSIEHNATIDKLEPNFLIKTQKLRILKIYGNFIRVVHRSAFSECARLGILELPGNLIDTIEDHAFYNCYYLTFVNLINNKLTVIEQGTLTGLIKLKTLYLSSNRIVSINDQSLAVSNTLQTIWLNKNQLSEITEGMFAKLYVLTTLDLSNNRISYIRPNAFNDLVSLKSLNLDSNYLGSLDWSQFIRQRHLNSLSLQGINCVVEVGPSPNIFVQIVFKNFQLCGGNERSTDSHQRIDSNNEESSEDKISYQHKTIESRAPVIVHPKRDQIPVWVVIMISVISFAFLLTLVILVAYCSFYIRQLDREVQRPGSHEVEPEVGIPILVQTDENGFLSTAI